MPADVLCCAPERSGTGAHVVSGLRAGEGPPRLARPANVFARSGAAAVDGCRASRETRREAVNGRVSRNLVIAETSAGGTEPGGRSPARRSGPDLPTRTAADGTGRQYFSRHALYVTTARAGYRLQARDLAARRRHVRKCAGTCASGPFRQSGAGCGSTGPSTDERPPGSPPGRNRSTRMTRDHSHGRRARPLAGRPTAPSPRAGPARRAGRPAARRRRRPAPDRRRRGAGRGRRRRRARPAGRCAGSAPSPSRPGA